MAVFERIGRESWGAYPIDGGKCLDLGGDFSPYDSI